MIKPKNNPKKSKEQNESDFNLAKELEADLGNSFPYDLYANVNQDPKPAPKLIVQDFKIKLTAPGLFQDVQKLRDRYKILIQQDKKVIETPESPPQFTDPRKMFEYIINESKNKKPKKFDERKFKIEEALELEVKDIMSRYSIPNRFLMAMNYFVKTGELYAHNFTMIEETIDTVTYTNRFGEKKIAIEIEPETTIEEIVARWPAIKERRIKYLGYNPQKQANKNQIDRDLRIAQLRSLGKTYEEIAKRIKDESYSKSMTYTQVGKILNSLKNRLDKAKKPLFPHK